MTKTMRVQCRQLLSEINCKELIGNSQNFLTLSNPIHGLKNMANPFLKQENTKRFIASFSSISLFLFAIQSRPRSFSSDLHLYPNELKIVTDICQMLALKKRKLPSALVGDYGLYFDQLEQYALEIKLTSDKGH